MECFVNGNIITQFAEVACAGQGRRAGTNDCHFVAVGSGNFRIGQVFLAHMIVSDKALQTADADALAVLAADALTFALFLLRADTAADSGKAVGGGDDLISGIKITFCNFCDKLRNADLNRASGTAQRILTIQASLSLVDCHFSSISECNFIKVLSTNNWILLWHRIFIFSHISHCYVYLQSFCRYACWLPAQSHCRKHHV